jgi:hypothetical protein
MKTRTPQEQQAIDKAYRYQDLSKTILPWMIAGFLPLAFHQLAQALPIDSNCPNRSWFDDSLRSIGLYNDQDPHGTALWGTLLTASLLTSYLGKFKGQTTESLALPAYALPLSSLVAHTSFLFLELARYGASRGAPLLFTAVQMITQMNILTATKYREQFESEGTYPQSGPLSQATTAFYAAMALASIGLYAGRMTTAANQAVGAICECNEYLHGWAALAGCAVIGLTLAAEAAISRFIVKEEEKYPEEEAAVDMNGMPSFQPFSTQSYEISPSSLGQKID